MFETKLTLQNWVETNFLSWQNCHELYQIPFKETNKNICGKKVFSAKNIGFGCERMPVCIVEAERKDEPL